MNSDDLTPDIRTSALQSPLQLDESLLCPVAVGLPCSSRRQVMNPAHWFTTMSFFFLRHQSEYKRELSIISFSGHKPGTLKHGIQASHYTRKSNEMVAHAMLSSSQKESTYHYVGFEILPAVIMKGSSRVTS